MSAFFCLRSVNVFIISAIVYSFIAFLFVYLPIEFATMATRWCNPNVFVHREKERKRNFTHPPERVALGNSVPVKKPCWK